MHIQIYGRPMCSSCEAAIELVERNGYYFDYNNVDLMRFDEVIRIVEQRKNKENRDLPIIFIDGREVETLDELREYFERMASKNTGLGNSLSTPEQLD